MAAWCPQNGFDQVTAPVALPGQSWDGAHARAIDWLLDRSWSKEAAW
jgi:hypothetical protein